MEKISDFKIHMSHVCMKEPTLQMYQLLPETKQKIYRRINWHRKSAKFISIYMEYKKEIQLEKIYKQCK